MLSIVFSSHLSNTDNDNFKNHISKTIGLKPNEYEVICYNNYNQYSLTELYNKGLIETKYDVVVFCHNDIIFNTNKWGKVLLNNFNNNPSYSILGVAGTTDIPLEAQGCWWARQNRMVGQVTHQHENKTWINKYSSNFNDKILNVVLVDGLFFAVNKKLIKTNFNGQYKGFHFYDVTFCLDNFKLGCNIGVMSNIHITHKSIGQVNQEWHNNRRQFVWDNWNDSNGYSVPCKEIFYKNDNIKLSKNKQPKVAIIIPTKDKVELLFTTIDSIINNNTYTNYKIFIADTGSTDENKLLIKEYINNSNVNIELIEYYFYNYAKINNNVVKNYVDSSYEVLLFSNNDLKLLNNCLDQMIECYNKNLNNVGTIGVRLHYADNSVQHSGQVVQVNLQNSQVYISHHGLGSYYNYHTTNKEVFGNTGAFMMINKNLFEKIGMFNQKYINCFEDVELNLKCLLNNKVNIILGEAVGYHYESSTRNDSETKQEEMQTDFNKIDKAIKENLKNKNLLKYVTII